jgi:hypothetical protein
MQKKNRGAQNKDGDKEKHIVRLATGHHYHIYGQTDRYICLLWKVFAQQALI